MNIAVRLSRLILGVVSLALGLGVWSSRLDFSVDTSATDVIKLTQLKSRDSISDCKLLESDSGWLLFIVEAYIAPVMIYQGLFETAEESKGLFVEYDPTDRVNGTMLRLGLAGKNKTLLFPIRVVRRPETVSAVIAVRSTSVRLVSSAIDQKILFPVDFDLQLNCENVWVGGADEVRCQNCDVTVRYASGDDPLVISRYLDDLSNVDAYNFKRVSGSFLTILGAAVLFRTPRKRVKLEQR